MVIHSSILRIDTRVDLCTISCITGLSDLPDMYTKA